MDKKTFASSAIWKIIEAFSTKGVALVVSIILARILLPEDYGIVTLTAVFISLSTILVQSGLSTALIRKETVDETDYNNGFIIGFGIAFLCYVMFFFGASIISKFYNEPLLIPVIRIQMLSLFLVAFGNIQTVIITREFRFRELCIANIIANIISGITGIVLAYLGFGVWALITYTLLRDGISNFVIFIRIKWFPSIKFDFSRLHALLQFSIWVLIATLVDFIGNNYTSTIMGKKYSLAELGLYGKGNQLPEMICLYTFGAISSVLLPTLAQYQNDTEKLKSICKRLIGMTSFIIYPMMFGLGLVAKNLVPFLFTEKWSACIPIFIFACISYGVNPLRVINMQLLYALGKSQKALLIEVIRSALLVIGVTFCAFIVKTNIYIIAAYSAIVAIINVLITQFFIWRFIAYGYKEWLKDMMPALLLCTGMSVAVLLIGMIPLHPYFIMFAQILIGIATYIVLSAITKNRDFNEIKVMIFEKFTNRKKQK